MSINTYQKGARNQRKAKRYYENIGYEVEIVRYNKWEKQKDFFGLWDLICVGKNDVIFVQVKTNQSPDKEWRARANKWGPIGKAVYKEWVTYKDYQRGDVPSARVLIGHGIV